MKLRLLSLGGVALAGLLAVVAIDSRAAEGLYKVGDKVEGFKAIDLSGKEVGLADIKGKVAFVTFFSLR